jgi:transposase
MVHFSVDKYNSTTITSELAVEALKNACINTKSTKGIILQSDLGTQYTSDLFTSEVKGLGIIQSFSRKGNPYDNACIESFHSLLKKEEINQSSYYDFKEAKMAVFEYIESWYNRNRIHSAIGFRTPNEVHDKLYPVA